MKLFGAKITIPPWYEWVYIAIAVATFKHSSWAYSITMEGAQPPMDWATFNPNSAGLWAAGTFLMWVFWGGLMALAIDASMFFSSREIRRKGNYAHLLTFVVAATFSAATQLLYASTHTVVVPYVASTLAALQPGTGWIWTIDEYRIVYLPISLPLTASIYTFAILFNERRHAQIVRATEDQIVKLKASAPGATFTAREAAKITQRNYQYVLAMCKRGVVGHRDADGVNWVLTEADMRRLDRGGVHQEEPEPTVVVTHSTPIESVPEPEQGPTITHHGS